MLRGLEGRQEVNPGLLLRDTRTMGQKIIAFFSQPSYVSIVLIGLCGASFLIPAVSDILALFGLGCFIYSYTRKQTLPFRLPMRARIKDYNDLKPGSGKPNM